MNNDANITPLLSHLRNEIRTQRKRRQTRATLRRELAHYNSPADRTELGIMMERYTDEETAEIRTILAGQAIAS